MPKGNMDRPNYGKLSSKSRLLRWFLLCICWSTYILYRSFVVGQMQYDRKSGKMVIRPWNIITIRVAMFLKVIVFIFEYLGVNYLIVGISPFLSIRNQSKEKHFLEEFIEAVAVYITIWNVCRLYNWLRSLAWNQSFVRLVNKVIHLIFSVESISGPSSLEGFMLLIIYVVQLELTLLQLINNVRVGMHLFIIHILLLEMFYNAYVAYLFLVLSWIASFNSFLGSHHMLGLPILQQRQRIVKLLQLYSRINNGHQDIIVLWLPVASVLFSSVVTMVCHWAAIIFIVLFNHDLDPIGKWNKVLEGHLGDALAPLLKILLIGLCNDRLAQLDRLLSLQLLFIDLRLLASGERSEKFAKELTNLQTCFDIQLRTQPIRNPLMCRHHICDSSFLLEFVFCILVDALSYVQYGISVDISLGFLSEMNLLLS